MFTLSILFVKNSVELKWRNMYIKNKQYPKTAHIYLTQPVGQSHAFICVFLGACLQQMWRCGVGEWSGLAVSPPAKPFILPIVSVSSAH